MKKLLLILGLLAAIPPTANAENEALGRLFLTPQERQELDRQRLQDPASGQRGGLTVNGEIRSSSGKRTRWINGQADWGTRQGELPALVGDTIHPETGEHESLLKGGRIMQSPRQGERN